MSITAITKDASSRVISWREDDYSFTVTRDASTGKPLLVRGTSAGRRSITGEYRYNTSTGAFTGLVGNVESSLAIAIALEASDSWSSGGGGGGGSGSTDLTVSRDATSVTVLSNSGLDAVLPAASTSQAGVMVAADKTKLDGIATAATANATDAQLRDRSLHTGVQAQSTVTNLVTDLAAKAPLASPALTGIPTVPTAAGGTNTTQAASTAFVQSAVASLVASSPATLDTLNELATALGNDPAFATTVSNSIGLKAPLASPTFTGTPAAPTATAGTSTTQLATTAFVAAAVALKQDITGVPSAFTSRALTNADNGDNLICGSAQVATVNTGLASGFGCSFKGTITFDGTATVTDVRTTGATNPWCALVNTGTNTYDVVGGKA